MEDAKVGKDLTDANNSKCPSLTLGFCYQRNLMSTTVPPKRDIGSPVGDFGITFFSPTLLHADGMKIWIVFRSDNPRQF